MDVVFVLTKRNSEYYTDDYVMQSDNIHDLVERILAEQDYHYEIYVTDVNNKQIPYLKWRRQ